VRLGVVVGRGVVIGRTVVVEVLVLDREGVGTGLGGCDGRPGDVPPTVGVST
jgi:hypothetical protein